MNDGLNWQDGDYGSTAYLHDLIEMTVTEYLYVPNASYEADGKIRGKKAIKVKGNFANREEAKRAVERRARELFAEMQEDLSALSGSH